jgi:hypothetical protein
MKNNEPIYFDGRCPINLNNIRATNTTLVSASQYGETSPVVDVKNKPFYYDGSLPLPESMYTHK